MRGLVIAGTHSGVGKTTIATGIMAALVARGVRVRPFKAGPDYIDPSYHAAVCGVPSRNLDTWLLEPAVLTEFFRRAMRGQDLAVVEGVMGLYDGFGADDDHGSTAHLAKLLGLPVVLVVDASGAGRSVAATVMGFRAFDPKVHIAGVILNGVGGDRHVEFIEPALSRMGVPILGVMPRKSELALPERHLGLVPTAEGSVAREYYGCLAKQVVRSIDLDHILAVAAPVASTGEPASGLFPESPCPPRTAVAVAQDRAFNFYYADSLDLLEAWGAEVVPFSPLEDLALPKGVGGVYVGGGFPELYAGALAANTSMLRSLREAAGRGLPIYGECGGLMYLGRSIDDQEGKTHAMAGVIPARSSLDRARLTVGYRSVSALEGSFLMKAGERVRGHEFHWSTLKEEPQAETAAYRVDDQPGRVEGFRADNVVCSYVHLHLGSKRELAPRFVASCARAARERS